MLESAGISEPGKDFIQTCLVVNQEKRPYAESLLLHTFIQKNIAAIHAMPSGNNVFSKLYLTLNLIWGITQGLHHKKMVA